MGRRKHEILKVYVTDILGLDVFVTGTVDVSTRNGRSFDEGFTANFLLVEQEEGQVLISEFRAYIVSLASMIELSFEGKAWLSLVSRKKRR